MSDKPNGQGVSPDCRLAKHLIPIAIAIIHQDGKYLMQLRDNIPNIIYPGVWGLFGGHVEPGENPEAGLKRELIEEINYPVEQLTKFNSYNDHRYARHVFSCHLSVTIDSLELNEGDDFGLLTLAEIKNGFGYSPKNRELRALGDLPRQIILDFIAA